nr:hypothetical protein [Tanacetum cinerariifolium]
MSSDNAQSAVTYTSISSDSDGPSWGIPLMNAGELPEMDPYEEVVQQEQAHPLSPAYVPDPIELDEHVPVYVSEPEHPEYHSPSDDDIQVEDDNEDPEKDPVEDPSEEHEPEDDDEDPAPPPPRHRGARISVRPQTPMAASTQALIDAFASGSSPFPLPPTSPAYDQAQLGRRVAMIYRKDDIFEEDMPPRRRFALTGSPLGEVHKAYLSSEARNRELLARLETLETHMSSMEWQRQSAEDLAVTQMMRIYTLEARTRADTVEDADSNCYRIMPVTRQGTNDAMTPESIQAMIDRAIQRNSTHTQDDVSQSSGGGLRKPVQPARVCSYTDFMKCQPLNFKGTKGVVGLSQWLEKME